MSKKRKIIIALCVLTVGVLTIGVLIIGALGYILFSRKGSDTEVVFAPTEVGTPEGPKVTKNIGPAGGTLASPDARLTLTVPPNALKDTVAFSIQPISNKAEGGLGLAYRLEPNGKTFTTPLQVSVRYDEHDLEGTAAEALSIAYQDHQGAWHPQEWAALDQNAKMLTVMTTHFTDWSFLSRLRIFPETATVRVGESVRLSFGHCYFHDNLLSRFKRFFDDATGTARCEVPDSDKHYWDIPLDWYTDIGTIDNPYKQRNVIYTAPPKKPTPNIATVSIPYALALRGDEQFGGQRGMFTAHITIVDRGYQASGSSHDEVYSGVKCDLEKPFTVNGTGLANLELKFVPAGPTSGNVSYASAYQPGGAAATEAGKGSYTVERIDTEKPRIKLSLSSAGSISAMGRTFNIPSKTADVYLDLTPLKSHECDGK